MIRIYKFKYILILIFLLLSLNFIFADNTDEEIRKTKYELEHLQGQINKFNKEKQLNLKQQSALAQDINKIEMNINSINEKIDLTESKIFNVKKELSDTNDKLSIAIDNVKNQDENLKKRLRVMYMFGESAFLEVLFNSKSISDFITRIDRIQLILDSDKKMLKTLEESKEEIENIKKEIELKKKELEDLKLVQAKEKANLEASFVELSNKKIKLAQDADEITKQLEEFSKDADKLTVLLKNLSSKRPYVEGAFLWPLDLKYNRITSPFLPFRINPVTGRKERHTGTDIGAPTGTPILASKAGVVLLSSWNGSYGNCVILDHGGGFTTVYGHASKLLCTPGMKVKAGDTIALVGTTGVSTGPHLHFEVRKNGEPQQPLDYVNKP